MKNTILVLLILMFTKGVCVSQQLGKNGPFYLPHVKSDTLYLGVENVLELRSNVAALTNITAGGAALKIEKNNLIIMPAHSGLLTINFIYPKKTEMKSFICMRLPYPPPLGDFTNR